MTCKDYTDLVPAFLKDRLDDTTLRDFLDHYDVCETCREEVEIQYLIDQVFHEMGVADGINLAKDLPAYIDKERKRLDYRQKLTTAAVSLELAAIVAALLTAMLYLS
ncbi:MAG: zf-HC2 domain-containing protein [Sarcina sp.]|nr:zf-HC2 domain-containing protein [Sarcina sp.]